MVENPTPTPSARSKSTAEPSPWMNFSDFAAYINVSQPTLRRLINQPDGPPFRKVNRRLVFNRGEGDAWMLTRPTFNEQVS
jgi:hypothetical protein